MDFWARPDAERLTAQYQVCERLGYGGVSDAVAKSGQFSHLVIRTQLERPAFTSPASSLGRTVRFLSATVAETAKPEEGRLSGFDLLPRPVLLSS